MFLVPSIDPSYRHGSSMQTAGGTDGETNKLTDLKRYGVKKDRFRLAFWS